MIKPDEDGRDRIYDVPQDEVRPFVFDSQVASVFDDMIRRSVPGYGLTLQLISSIASRLKHPVRVYDLGCSLGAGMASADRGMAGSGVEIVGIDTSDSMLSRANEHLSACGMAHPFQLIRADVCDYTLLQHNLCLLNFTLQFVDPTQRGELIRKIHDALLPGGYLILSEKIEFETVEEQELQTDWHHAFKSLNGYSDLEISQKRTSLENRLVPETRAAHVHRLRSAGFSRVVPWFQAFNFVSFVAVR